MKRLNFAEWVSLALIFYILLLRVAGIFSYSTDLEGVEFCSVHFVQLFKIRHYLYSDASVFPYLLIVYTPLYYYIMLPVLSILPIDLMTDVHSMYMTGRTISFVLLFVDFFLLVKTIRLLFPEFRGKIYLFLFLLFFIPIHFYTFRPDSFKVTCFLLFLFYSLKYEISGSLKHFVPAFLFLLAGILFKQDALIYGILLYAVFFLSFRKKIYLAGLFLLPAVLLALLYGSYLSTGINFLNQFFLYNVQYDSDFHLNIKLISIYTLRATPLLYFSYQNLFSGRKMVSALALLGIFCFLSANLSMLRMGANMNYTYESSLLLLINGAVFFKDRFLPDLLRGLYFLFLVLSFTGFLPVWADYDREVKYRKEYFHDKAAAVKIQALIKNDITFLPSQKYYVFYAKSRLIYGYDWHYDRYCELNLPIRLKPNFAKNDIVEDYDKNFKNGTVQYIILKDEEKSKEHILKYYPGYIFRERVSGFLIYQFDPQRMKR